MDILEEYEITNPLSKEVLLSEIDEYEMYKHYLGFYPELRTGYNSPLRKGDESPSFSLFTNQYPPCEYRWKDSGLGLHGDIFKMVRILYDLKSDRDVILRIRQDLSKEGVDNIPQIRLQERPKDKGSTIIKVKSKGWTEEAMKWWNQYSISLNTLSKYNVSEVEWFSMNDRQIFPKGLCFAYRELDKFQIYQPTNPDFKFRNNYNEFIIMGFHQLSYTQDILIITKSKKDIMVLSEMGYDAISPRSETTLIPKPYLTYLEGKYSRIVTFFDNDILKQSNTGREASLNYKYESIFIPDTYAKNNLKDISDFVKFSSIFVGVKLIKKLLDG